MLLWSVFSLLTKKFAKIGLQFRKLQGEQRSYNKYMCKKANGGKFKNCNYVHTVFSIRRPMDTDLGFGGLVVIFEPIREQNTLRTF